jgi:hypothetical protein
MREISSGHDFVEPMILKILEKSMVSMSTLAINYKVNEAVGRTINLNVIKNRLIFLVKNKKIFESFDKENNVTYYKLIV